MDRGSSCTLLLIALAVIICAMEFVGLSISNSCAVPVRVWVVSSVPSEDQFANCDFTIRSIEDGAESTIRAACPAPHVAGNTSVTFEACHPNGDPSDLHFLRPASGIQAPVGVGIVFLIQAALVLLLSGLLFLLMCVADCCCGGNSYQQVPTDPTGKEGTCSQGMPAASAPVVIEIPFASHANKIDTVD